MAKMAYSPHSEPRRLIFRFLTTI